MAAATTRKIECPGKPGYGDHWIDCGSTYYERTWDFSAAGNPPVWRCGNCCATSPRQERKAGTAITPSQQHVHDVIKATLEERIVDRESLEITELAVNPIEGGSVQIVWGVSNAQGNGLLGHTGCVIVSRRGKLSYSHVNPNYGGNDQTPKTLLDLRIAVKIY